jgi:hypothetical protein
VGLDKELWHRVGKMIALPQHRYQMNQLRLNAVCDYGNVVMLYRSTLKQVY